MTTSSIARSTSPPSLSPGLSEEDKISIGVGLGIGLGIGLPTLIVSIGIYYFGWRADKIWSGISGRIGHTVRPARTSAIQL
jgi:hypothetical protein